MQENTRAVVVGLSAAAVALTACAALTLLYVEWVWFRDDPDVRLGTMILLLICVAVVAATAFGAHRYFAARMLALGLMGLVIVPVMFVGLVVLSHNNACFGGESLPIPHQWALWGRECGR
jgi:hypothetical protein